MRPPPRCSGRPGCVLGPRWGSPGRPWVGGWLWRRSWGLTSLLLFEVAPLAAVGRAGGEDVVDVLLVGHRADDDGEHAPGPGGADELEAPLVGGADRRIAGGDVLCLGGHHLVLGDVLAVPLIPDEVRDVQVNSHREHYTTLASDIGRHAAGLLPGMGIPGSRKACVLLRSAEGAASSCRRFGGRGGGRGRQRAGAPGQRVFTMSRG